MTKRDRKITLMRSAQTAANERTGIGGRLKNKQPPPITLPKLASDERKMNQSDSEDGRRAMSESGRYNVAINRLEMPARMLKLPVDARGYPVPKFVAWIDGVPEFRVIESGWLAKCVRHRLCWLCGEALGRNMAFVIGPMCSVTRRTSEPPCHLDCARFACKACPFLTQPKRKRNEHDMPEEARAPAGVGIARNPGVTLIWVTTSYVCERAQRGNEGTLFQLGDPTRLEWYAHGRKATRAEIMESIDTGLPILRRMAERDGPEAVEDFTRMVARGMALVPAA